MNSKPRNEAVTVPINQTFHHDLSHTHITTMDFFRLQPIMCQEVIPGGSYPIDLRAVISSAPLATQVYGGCHLDLHAFFVPNRIVFENWNNYYAGNDRSLSMTDSLPYVNGSGLSSICGVTQGQPSNANNYKEIRRVFGSLGYPTFSSGNNTAMQNMRYSLLQARAYQKIWWDYYRDSVNIPEANENSYLDTSGGTMNISPFVVRYRTFKKDYVSTLLSSPQMGDAPGAATKVTLGATQNSTPVYPMYANYAGIEAIATNDTSVTKNLKLIGHEVTASALRGAMATQRYLERLNVTGTRPMERLLSILGAKPSPERLDMAEFLGAKTIRVNIDGLVNSGSFEQVSAAQGNSNYNAWGIANEMGTYGDSYGQGYQTGHGSGSGQSDVINYHATEHGHIVVIASLIPEYTNPNTINRQFIRGLSTPNADRFDFFTPDFDGLGYQEALLSEIATPSPFDISQVENSTWPTAFNPYNVVGYEPKYEDYRRVPNRISGDFQESESALAMRYLAFTLSYPEIFEPSDVKAGLNLTTSSFAYRALFDKHFQISDPSLDHFICYFSIVNDATLPVTGNQLPTELSDLANSETLNVSNGGVRI